MELNKNISTHRDGSPCACVNPVGLSFSGEVMIKMIVCPECDSISEVELTKTWEGDDSIPYGRNEFWEANVTMAGCDCLPEDLMGLVDDMGDGYDDNFIEE